VGKSGILICGGQYGEMVLVEIVFKHAKTLRIKAIIWAVR
jgi:hypothetical protein